MFYRNRYGINFMQKKIPTVRVGIVGIVAVGVIEPYHYFIVI